MKRIEQMSPEEKSMCLGRSEARHASSTTLFRGNGMILEPNMAQAGLRATSGLEEVLSSVSGA